MAQDCSKDPVIEFERRMQNIRRVWNRTWALTVLPGFIVFAIFAVGRNQPFIGMIGFVLLGAGVMRGLYLHYTYSRCPQCGTYIKAAFFPLGLHCPGCGVELIRRTSDGVFLIDRK